MKALLCCSVVVAFTGCTGAQRSDGVAAKRVEPHLLQPVGRAAYLKAIPDGEHPPSNFAGVPVMPKFSPGTTQMPVSNDWWSSLLWQFDFQGKPNPYSQPLFAHPLAAQAQADGLSIGYPDVAEVKERTFLYPFKPDLLVGVNGLAAPRTTVEAYGDWTVTAAWRNEAKEGAFAQLLATLGHGLPFVYLTAQGGNALLHATAEVQLWYDKPGVMGLTINDHHYGVFTPAGAHWSRQARAFTSNLNGKDFFSVAVLPDNTPATLALYQRHAFAFVKNSRVAWTYDRKSARVSSRFSFDIENKQAGPGFSSDPLVALYPHQWKHTSQKLAPFTYASSRGTMKVAETSTFSTDLAFHGVLPALAAPPVDDDFYVKSDLQDAVRAELRRADLFPPGPEQTNGTYWNGKSLMRVAQLAWIADQIGDGESRDRAVAAVRKQMEAWFDGQPPEAFFYESHWRTLLGTPAEYRTGWEMNDHHFHYGYFLYAAATLAKFDPSWVQPEAYGQMVDLLMKDAANTDRDDTQFPFLRHFDPYAGHSWANGPSLFAEGNNEESSSEDVNFAVGVLLWGALTQRPEVEALGAYLYTNVVAAIENYWFNMDHDVFPAAFKKPVVAMVWGSGGKYDTWWDRNPIYVHGINMLPFSGGSLYLGYHPGFVKENYQYLVQANRGDVLLWRDIIWMYLALSDPAEAARLYKKDRYFDPEFGNSHAFLYHWIASLRRAGAVNTDVTADAPTFAVFRRNNQNTYVGFNPTAEARTLSFSDGTTMSLRPLELQSRTQGAGKR
ncbi:MAG: glycosyl hydrolase [Deltaproteobacteria bacterium]|nr:glycosyl hydrolase [Deltaproteobacteria bacterium]